jgi:hypothetical protein
MRRPNSTLKGNKGGKGGPSKFQPEHIEIATRLCERGLTDENIAEVLGVNERTIHSWKLQHEEFAAAIKRTKGIVCDQVEESMLMRANGFERKVQKATASGKKVTINEYFPPDVAAGKFYLQHRRPEVFREQREVNQKIGIEQGFLTFLQKLDDKAKLERETGQLPKLIEQQVEDAIVIEDDDEAQQ